MKAAVRILTLAVVPLLATGQQSPAALAARRAAYLDAYRIWREADPNLERDLRTASRAELAGRTEHAASKAARYVAARRDYADALAAECQQTVERLRSTSVNADLGGFIDGSKNQQAFLAQQVSNLTRHIESYSRDSDRGIVQLRQAMEREKAALQAIQPVLADRQKSLVAIRTLEAQADGSLKNVLAKYQEMLAGLQQSAKEAGREADLWKTYYGKLNEFAQNPSSAGATAVSAAESPKPTAPATPPPATPKAPVSPAETPESATHAAPIPAGLDRLLGGWTYPTANPSFFGDEPEFMDLVVRQQNGMITGSLYARFKKQSIGARDPVVRFDFRGKPSNSKTQIFDLVTSDGGRGVIELIPGPALNLLEVNFRSQPRPDKVYRGDAILVKK